MTRNPVTWSVPNVCTSANVFASHSAQTGTRNSVRQAEASRSTSKVRPLLHYPGVCTALASRCCRLSSHLSASLCNAAAAAAQVVVPLYSLIFTLLFLKLRRCSLCDVDRRVCSRSACRLAVLAVGLAASSVVPASSLSANDYHICTHAAYGAPVRVASCESVPNSASPSHARPTAPQIEYFVFVL